MYKFKCPDKCCEIDIHPTSNNKINNYKKK